MTRLLERRLPKRDMAQAGEVSDQPALGGRCARSMPSDRLGRCARGPGPARRGRHAGGWHRRGVHGPVRLRSGLAGLPRRIAGHLVACVAALIAGLLRQSPGLKRYATWALAYTAIAVALLFTAGGPSSEPPRRRRFEPSIRAGAFGYRPLARRRFARPRRSLTFAAMTSGSRHTRPRPRRSPTTRTTPPRPAGPAAPADRPGPARALSRT